MERKGDPAAVRMEVMTVASFLAIQGETIGFEGGGER